MEVIPFSSVSAMSQHDFNLGLELANPGIIEKVASLRGIKESCGGDSRFGRLRGALPLPQYGEPAAPQAPFARDG
jgi:hypothetical protein